MSIKSNKNKPSILFDALPDVAEATEKETAIVYCGDKFGTADARIGNGLIRQSDRYEIISIIDSELAGQDSGKVLTGENNGTPIFRDLGTALAQAGRRPACLIFGTTPTGEDGKLAPVERRLLLRAIGYGINIVSGVDELLNDDPEFIAALDAKANVVVHDVKQHRDEKEMIPFSDSISELTCPRIAVLGTDTANGKSNTTRIMSKALGERGIKAVIISTGPTSMIQGARYGLATDAIPTKFAAGELEQLVIEVAKQEDPDLILIEGQAALSDASSDTSHSILKGCAPQAVVLQHAPARKNRYHSENSATPEPSDEIKLIESSAKTKVIGLTLSHEDMNEGEVSSAIRRFEKDLGIPTTDPLGKSTQKLIDMTRSAFPDI